MEALNDHQIATRNILGVESPALVRRDRWPTRSARGCTDRCDAPVKAALILLGFRATDAELGRPRAILKAFRISSRASLGLRPSPSTCFWFCYRTSCMETRDLPVHTIRMPSKGFLASVLVLMAGSLIAQQPKGAGH